MVNPKFKIQIFQECTIRLKFDMEANNEREDVLDKHLK